MPKPHYEDMDNYPPEIVTMLQDYKQVVNLLNGDTCRINGKEQPVASRLLAFLSREDVSDAWEAFNRNRPRL